MSEKSNGTICEYCKKECKSLNCLKIHVMHEHKNNSVTSKSGESDETFEWERAFKNHVVAEHKRNATQMPKKLLICQFCEKRFLNRSLLRNHLLKHSDFRPHKCNKCGMHFKYKQTWSKHIKTVHSTERNFQCAMCDKAFKTKSYLAAHENNVHQSHTPVTCKFCDKPLKTKKYLHDHVRQVHLKRERKYECPSCPLAFISPKDLRRHSKVHEGIKEHQCKLCCKCYTRAAYLKVHVKKNHKEMTSIIKDIIECKTDDIICK